LSTQRDPAALGFDPASVFGPVADQYEMSRPSYPGALYDLIDREVGGLTGATVLELGAGTGIASRELGGRGARVLALEPSMPMIQHWRARTSAPRSTPEAALAGTGRSPSAVVRARAECLPVMGSTVDLVASAQAWHWFEPFDAAVECHRVLRPGGLLALWWNMSVEDAGWVAELEGEFGLSRYGHGHHGDHGPEAGLERLLTEQAGFVRAATAELPWTWRVSVERWVSAAGTRSEVARLGSDATPLLGAISARLARRFAEGQITERFVCRLVIATA
jgi:SAM-dependent methyltransferase